MPARSRIRSSTCTRCGSCCVTYPCALAPDDLVEIADFLGMSCSDVFRRYLVLDYTLASGIKLHYLCPARVGDKPGRIVDWNWAFESSPCIFLHGNDCAINPVKPRGGRTYLCHLISSTKHNLVIFGKNRAAEAWEGNPLLEQLIAMAESEPSDIPDCDKPEMACL